MAVVVIHGYVSPALATAKMCVKDYTAYLHTSKHSYHHHFLCVLYKQHYALFRLFFLSQEGEGTLFW